MHKTGHRFVTVQPPSSNHPDLVPAIQLTENHHVAQNSTSTLSGNRNIKPFHNATYTTSIYRPPLKLPRHAKSCHALLLHFEVLARFLGPPATKLRQNVPGFGTKLSRAAQRLLNKDSTVSTDGKFLADFTMWKFSFVIVSP